MNIEDRFSPHPWYKAGLHFSCTQCGKCCTGSPGYIWVTEEEIQGIAEYLGISMKECKIRYVKKRDNRFTLIDIKSKNWDCIFLKNNLCSIHPARPKQCKNFPWWHENLNTPESWKSAAKSCEGINDQATLVTLEEIQQSLQNQ